MKASLHIQAVLKNGITKLGNCYFSPPFKVMNITEDKLGKDLQLMLMSSSPGILDEDEYHMQVDVDANCSLQLHTQSYQRLFNMQKGAKQLIQVNMQEGATFVYLPHPSVPHEHSSFVAKSRIHLSNNCKLIWGEVLTCGRKLNGEIFKFAKYHSSTEIFIDNKLVIKENLLMQPSLMNVNAIGQMEGYTHQASLICLNNELDVNEVTDVLHDYLSQQEEMVCGVTAAPSNGFIVRLLGNKAEKLFDCLKVIVTMSATKTKLAVE